MDRSLRGLRVWTGILIRICRRSLPDLIRTGIGSLVGYQGGVEETAQASINSANEIAGRHLLKAWNEAQSLRPDTSAVMTEAIRAVEGAAGPVVIPRDPRPNLSKIVSALRDNEAWTLILSTRDDGHPDQRLVLIGMIETLAFAEQHRHSGDDPSDLQAIAHVQLASVIVAWFSTGTVVKTDS